MSDPAVIDVHPRRVRAEADKVRADFGAEIVRLREQLDTALKNRADAAAAVAEAEAEAEADEKVAQLGAAHRKHQDELERSRVEHAAELERGHGRFAKTDAHGQRITDLEALAQWQRGQITRQRAESDKAAAAATIGRLESDLAAARADTQTE
ncbi:hypothetical protein G352_10882 [Rhodococcus ruber BKS 20-38]|uniref:Uncharacterized protein n=1 Tax=Rhodococcus ruber BKS 20-38 TaxID=1278076 RepID=M2ZXG2_9NOCA|nr:hypothetical protein [Rhodococcus ruber]EME65039.1 hypothetical protein G352_10882 [Rhodococcus ruber BKS 20-38]